MTSKRSGRKEGVCLAELMKKAGRSKKIGAIIKKPPVLNEYNSGWVYFPFVTPRHTTHHLQARE
jgi:hypothetical protein